MSQPGSQGAPSTVSSIADNVEPAYDPTDMMAMMHRFRPSDTMPLVLVSYDLSTVEDVSDPRDYFEEIRFINK
jgi:hypothetical protein